MKRYIILFCLFTVPTFAWDGYDYQTGSSIEIGSDNLVRYGNDIDIYDYNTGEYRSVEVQNINRYGNSVELEVYDPNNKMD